MLEWLSRLGFDAYLYAPKADAHLRKAWRAPWPPRERAHFREVAREGSAQGLVIVAGLSPFALYLAYDRDARDALRARVEEIVACGAGGLALLFDDMPGDHDALAERQAEIAVDVAAWASGLDLYLCPTYYSEDPVLDRVFGHRPPNYLEELAERLPRSFTPFWTGPQVCSAAIDADQAAAVTGRWRRALALWDNYPVNDSRARSEHLYVAPLTGREAAPVMGLESHWCNAMNQPALSLPALASLPALYGRRSAARDGVFKEAGVTPSLLRACLPLATRARSELGEAERRATLATASAASLAATELDDWLGGTYAFDPACLTD
jgi:hypothetical protein